MMPEKIQREEEAFQGWSNYATFELSEKLNKTNYDYAMFLSVLKANATVHQFAEALEKYYRRSGVNYREIADHFFNANKVHVLDREFQK